MESQNPALVRLERIQKVQDFLHEMLVWHNRLVTTTTASELMDQKLRLRQERRIRQIAGDLNKLLAKLRYDSGAEVPEDLDQYLAELRASIPQGVE